MDLQKLLNEMTVDEKLAQMTQLVPQIITDKGEGVITGPMRNFGITKKETSSVGTLLGASGAKQIKDLQDFHLSEDPHKIPLLFMADVIHGYRTLYPVPLGLGASFDVDLAEKCCAMAAKEASVGGIHVTFAPMTDLVRDARWGRCMETTGEDPYLNSKMAQAMVRGFQGDLGKDNIAACVKHFAAYGACDGGRDYDAVEMGDHTLREYYLPAYKAAVDAGVELLMTSFNTLNGIPSSANKYLVNDILRKEWGFDGIVISDFNAFYEMISHGICENEKECAEKALNATSDIEMMSTCFVKFGKALLEEGKISEEQIDNAVMRILKLKEKLGLFDNAYRAASEEDEQKIHLCPEYRELARIAAEKSAVLLENNGVLPFRKDVKKIAIIGPVADHGMTGGWYCCGKSSEAISVIQGIKNAIPNAEIAFARGCSAEPNEKAEDVIEQIFEAKKIAQDSDIVILCLGEEIDMSGEAHSRARISVSDSQTRLIKEVCEVNKNTAVVFYCGRPLALEKIKDVAPATIIFWHPGTEGGNALANLLFGNVNFQAKLPMSFPYEGQSPYCYNHLRTGRPSTNGGYCLGYRDNPYEPVYPFGFGLSYTTFDISSPTLSSEKMTEEGEIVVSVTVKNTGKCEGIETVQLYIQDVTASIARPVKELKGYQKVTLAPGEEKVVTFKITVEKLKFHTFEGKFEAEKGKFKVFVGNRSDIESFEVFRLI